MIYFILTMIIIIYYNYDYDNLQENLKQKFSRNIMKQIYFFYLKLFDILLIIFLNYNFIFILNYYIIYNWPTVSCHLFQEQFIFYLILVIKSFLQKNSQYHILLEIIIIFYFLLLWYLIFKCLYYLLFLGLIKIISSVDSIYHYQIYFIYKYYIQVDLIFYQKYKNYEFSNQINQNF